MFEFIGEFEKHYLATASSSPPEFLSNDFLCSQGLGKKRTSNTKSASTGRPCLNPKVMMFMMSCSTFTLEDIISMIRFFNSAELRVVVSIIT